MNEASLRVRVTTSLISKALQAGRKFVGPAEVHEIKRHFPTRFAGSVARALFFTSRPTTTDTR